MTDGNGVDSFPSNSPGREDVQISPSYPGKQRFVTSIFFSLFLVFLFLIFLIFYCDIVYILLFSKFSCILYSFCIVLDIYGPLFAEHRCSPYHQHTSFGAHLGMGLIPSLSLSKKKKN